MSPSTIPAAKASILEILGARPGLAGVTVAWGGPASESDMAAEMIHLGDVEQTEDPVTMDGRRAEDYTIGVLVKVRSLGNDEQATEQRAWTLQAEIAAAVRADATLGAVLNAQGAEIAGTKGRNVPLTDGWYSELTLELHCRSRI